jgi:hypothetical protein
MRDREFSVMCGDVSNEVLCVVKSVCCEVSLNCWSIFDSL